MTILLLIVVFADVIYAFTVTSPPLYPPFSHTRTALFPPPPDDIRLDSRLPIQTLKRQQHFTNINAKFGSRFDFAISPGTTSVRSGTDGLFHDTVANYIVGLAPMGQHKTYIFHMGAQNSSRGDTYISNERWIQGLDTTRWSGDAINTGQIHVTVDFIDPFLGEPGCTAIVNCALAVKDDTVPIFIVGITLQNFSKQTQAGEFLFGSNRRLPPAHACAQSRTSAGTAVNAISYAASADATGGMLFLAGERARWQCNVQDADRAGLAWNYRVEAAHTSTAYLILGGWNTHSRLFVNTQLPVNCQNEGLYTTAEWSSANEVISFAIDNLSTHDNLLARAQRMENYLITNAVLTPEQRWLIGDALRNYKASSWLTARPACAGGGYDAAVYEGTYGFLTTVDVLHEYGYFEITRVPWFFKAAMTTVFQNATRNTYGTYFQHDQGGDVNSHGNCTPPGSGTPTLRSTCYIPPYAMRAAPMPTEENDDAVLLMAFYEFETRDIPFLRQHIDLIDDAMRHNIAVGNVNTGIADNFQDTTTTYDAASDCLHNNMAGAGNLYYQGLKEATGYRATAYLDTLLADSASASTWQSAAAKIENAILVAFGASSASPNTHFLPLANNNAFNNCDGHTITSGEGLFYLHLIHQDSAINATLLQDLARQYRLDLQATTLAEPAMIAMTSTAATGPQCVTGHCHRYTWFSKVLLSGLVADLVYTHYGCAKCARLDLTQAAYAYNVDSPIGFSDGFYDDRRAWGGHFYPRGLISWALLNPSY